MQLTRDYALYLFQDLAQEKLGSSFYSNEKFKKAMKKMRLIIEKKNKGEAIKFLPKLNSELMRIAKTGIIKKRNASRNVSRFTKKINNL